MEESAPYIAEEEKSCSLKVKTDAVRDTVFSSVVVSATTRATTLTVKKPTYFIQSLTQV